MLNMLSKIKGSRKKSSSTNGQAIKIGEGGGAVNSGPLRKK